MKASSSKGRAQGFAVVETLLILVIIAGIVGIGAYVLRQKNNANSTLSSSTAPAVTSAPAGTTAAIDQLTQQDAQAETSVDSAADAAAQQAATSANSAVSNVGGAYNETSL